MNFFAIILCLIPLCFCSGRKRPRPISETPQDLLAITFSKGAFNNVPNEIFQLILNFLPFKYQLSFASVNSFWSKKFSFLRKTNLDYSKKNFLKATSSPSKVSFQKLFYVINCFTEYWEDLCRNSENTNFLNLRPQLEAELDKWLCVNMDQIKSIEWNTPRNKEGDTLSYIILRQLLLSPYFFLIFQHPIWKAMAAHDEIRNQAICDFLLQVPIMLGKAAIFYISQCTGNIKQPLQVATERGIESGVFDAANRLGCTAVILQKLALLKDFHIEVKKLAHQGIENCVLRLESIIVTAIETGSIDIFRDGYISKMIGANDFDYKATKKYLISNGFELAYIHPFIRKELYSIPIISFINMKNPRFLPFLFRKILATPTPNQSQILMFLCSSIPNGFDFHRIKIIEIVSILSPFVSEFLPLNTLENFYQVTGETQVDVFKYIIKKEVDRLVSNLKDEYEKEGYACIEQELNDTSLSFNAAPPAFPFLYHPSPRASQFLDNNTKAEICIKDKIGLYFLAKIGFIGEYQFSLVSCSGRIIPAANFKSSFLLCQSRKLTLPDGTVFVTHAEQVLKNS